MAGNLSAPGASVVSRVLSLLYAFDGGHRALGLSDLARRAGLPLTTAHRLAGQLVEGGALVRDGAGDFSVSARLWEVGLLAPVRADLREVAAPFLNDIHAATRATVHLAVRDGTRVLYLERLSGRVSVPVVSQAGSRLPLHCTGVGKALLAHAPDAVLRRVLRSLTRVTPYTVTEPARLSAQLDRVRRDGFATTVDEMTVGASSIAVPVRSGAGGPVVASIGVVVRGIKRDRARLVAALQVAAQGIGRGLSAPGPPPAGRAPGSAEGEHAAHGQVT